MQSYRIFLSTPSARRATIAILDILRNQIDFYPRPPRGGRHPCAAESGCKRKISIHALREEGDGYKYITKHQNYYFYPRPPRGGRPEKSRSSTAVLYFYPRPPRGGRRGQQTNADTPIGISIHALREEGDNKHVITDGERTRFLSTPSARRATGETGAMSVTPINISIHALREEGDLDIRKHGQTTGYFYPRPPRGGRLFVFPLYYVSVIISIHALREEGDRRLPNSHP